MYKVSTPKSSHYRSHIKAKILFFFVLLMKGYSRHVHLVTSKDLVVRAVYYDSRPRNGHQNASVFLLALRKNIMNDNLIVKCGVGETTTDKLHIRLIGEASFRDRWIEDGRYLSHEEIMLDCFDLPVKNGSRAFVIYMRQLNDTDLFKVESEQPLIFPSPQEPSPQGGKYGFTVLTCGKLFGTGAPWMEEWLRYQKTLGVDHVHWNVKDSIIEAKALENPYIKKEREEGYLSINVWKQHFQSDQIWYYSQGLMYEDCIYRFRGTYDYIFMLDTDDFFTPRIHNEPDIHHYINLCTNQSNTGSCEFWWIEYYPDQCGVKKGPLPKDGNVTSWLLSFRAHTVMSNHKAVHKSETILDAATHFAAELMPGYLRRRTFPKHIAYIAHVRKSKHSKLKC